MVSKNLQNGYMRYSCGDRQSQHSGMPIVSNITIEIVLVGKLCVYRFKTCWIRDHKLETTSHTNFIPHYRTRNL